MKYLITGGAGFIGSNLVKKILENGDFARVVDNFSTGRKENIKEFLDNPNFELIKGDLTDLKIAQDAVKGMDFVLHQAAINSVPRSIDNPINTNNSNINGTLNILIASKDEKVKKFIYASSSSIYGNSTEITRKESMPINPISPYGLTKYTGERYCQIFWNIYKLPTICLRYFNVFGPKQNPNSEYSAVIPKFIKAALNGESVSIFGDGEQSRDFTFVDNVVNANLLAAESKDGIGEFFNIACGERTSLNRLVELIKINIGLKFNPDKQGLRQGDIVHAKADISKADKILGYKPTINFEKGLKMTIDWYKEENR